MARPRKSIRTEMGWSSTDRVVVRGRDLPGELLGRINLGDMAWLELTGAVPNPQQSAVFNAILVTLVEHGLTSQAIAARLIYQCSPDAIQGAVAAGLCGMGSVFGGGSEGAARLLQEKLPQDPHADLGVVAGAVVADYRARGAIIPGLGHTTHRPIDPRTPRLFEIAAANGLRGRYVALLEAIAGEAERAYGRALPINATGAIGALSCELGLDWKLARGIAIMGRAVGLVGHIAEELRNPIAGEISRRVNEEATAEAQAREAPQRS